MNSETDEESFVFDMEEEISEAELDRRYIEALEREVEFARQFQPRYGPRNHFADVLVNGAMFDLAFHRNHPNCDLPWDVIFEYY